MEYFEIYTVNKPTVDYLVNQSKINELTDIEQMVYKPMDTESTITDPRLLEKCLHIMDYQFSQCSVEFFQFSRECNIGLVCLPRSATRLLQTLDIEILEPLVNAYYLELGK